MVLIVVIILLVLAFGGFGYYGSNRAGYGPGASWSPLGIIVVLLVIAWLMGWLPALGGR